VSWYARVNVDEEEYRRRKGACVWGLGGGGSAGRDRERKKGPTFAFAPYGEHSGRDAGRAVGAAMPNACAAARRAVCRPQVVIHQWPADDAASCGQQ